MASAIGRPQPSPLHGQAGVGWVRGRGSAAQMPARRRATAVVCARSGRPRGSSRRACSRTSTPRQPSEAPRQPAAAHRVGRTNALAARYSSGKATCGMWSLMTYTDGSSPGRAAACPSSACAQACARGAAKAAGALLGRRRAAPGPRLAPRRAGAGAAPGRQGAAASPPARRAAPHLHLRREAAVVGVVRVEGLGGQQQQHVVAGGEGSEVRPQQHVPALQARGARVHMWDSRGQAARWRP